MRYRRYGNSCCLEVGNQGQNKLCSKKQNKTKNKPEAVFYGWPGVDFVNWFPDCGAVVCNGMILKQDEIGV